MNLSSSLHFRPSIINRCFEIQALRKYFAFTFIGSILWIAFFSYLMVWWANVIGETLAIPNEVTAI
ncbi:unnamed protein product [Gongylonema pulchrum]|uniref:Gamma-secretase subunit PEN-2 n=1 Tax=Gongylonema pulchrum TaxID=637853 RepID=A0A183EJC6_9BILA|nr:unnamed protein product [Gongylonema pulchrum]